MSDNLLNKLTQLKLPAMAGSLIRQRETPQTYDELSFEERLGLLVDDELLNRENGRVARLRKSANLKYQAAPEGLHYPVSRGLRADQMRELLNGHYITHKKNLLITGPTGCGKSWVANALGEQACRQKHSVQYWRTGRLLEMLAQGRVDGSWLPTVVMVITNPSGLCLPHDCTIFNQSHIQGKSLPFGKLVL